MGYVRHRALRGSSHFANDGRAKMLENLLTKGAARSLSKSRQREGPQIGHIDLAIVGITVAPGRANLSRAALSPFETYSRPGIPCVLGGRSFWVADIKGAGPDRRDPARGGRKQCRNEKPHLPRTPTRASVPCRPRSPLDNPSIRRQPISSGAFGVFFHAGIASALAAPPAIMQRAAASSARKQALIASARAGKSPGNIG
jgi:hypothetical protein